MNRKEDEGGEGVHPRAGKKKSNTTMNKQEYVAGGVTTTTGTGGIKALPRPKGITMSRAAAPTAATTATTTSPSKKGSSQPSLSLPIMNNWEPPNLTLGLTPFSFDMYLSEEEDDTQSSHRNKNKSSSDSSLQPPWIHLPPQTNWAVQDNKLKSRPPFFPPINPYTTVYIGDASPSTIAVRISECLRKNNVIVEYDDEAATAHAYTCDKVLLDISLFRGIKGHSTGFSKGSVDLSHGVIVECIRIQGDTIAYHRICHGIFACARGDSDGLDQERRKHGCFQDSPLGRCPMTQLVNVSTTMSPAAAAAAAKNSMSHVPLSRSVTQRFYHFQPNFVESTQDTTASSSSSSSNVIFTAAGALHKALSLLEKDRYDAQTLGLQLLVMLTDTFSTRLPVAIHCSICVLGGPIQDVKSKIQVDHSPLQRIHDWIISLLIKRDELFGTSSTTATMAAAAPAASSSFSTKFIKSTIKKGQENTTTPATTAASEWSMEHYVSLRILALRVLVNALSVLVTQKDVMPYHPSQKQSLLRLDPFWTDEFLLNFIQDIRGAGRPPHTYLGSSNEAALSIRFLRLLAIHSKVAKLHLMHALRALSMQEVLDRAFVVGMSTHRSLEEECILLLQLLTA